MSTPPPTAVRRATSADAGSVLELLLELADHEDSTAHVHVDTDSWRGLLANPDVVVLLAEHDKNPVGYVSSVRQLNLWQGRHILALDDLYVRAEHRGRHVGEELMRALARHAHTSGHQLIRWELETNNAGARRFYQRLGATVRDKSIATWQPTHEGSGPLQDGRPVGRTRQAFGPMNGACQAPPTSISGPGREPSSAESASVLRSGAGQ